MPARVSALKSVDFPTFGSPTMPQRMPIAMRVRTSVRRVAGGRRRMQPVHHLLGALGDQPRELRDRELDRLAHQALLHRACALEHVVDDLVAIAGVSDTDADPPEVLAEVCDDVLDAIVPAGTTALLEARDAGRQVELVVHDENLFGRDLEVLGEGAHGLAAAVHVAHRLHEPQRRVRDRHAADVGVVAALRLQAAIVAARQLVDEPETRVVARVLVLDARIAEADDQLQRTSRHTLLLAVALLRVLGVLAALRGGCAGGTGGRGRARGCAWCGTRCRSRARGARRSRGGSGTGHASGGGSGGLVDGWRLLLFDARHVDRGHGTVTLREQVHEIDARRELEVGELDHLVDLEARDVDLDELRQVLRQAAHLDVVAHVPEHAALLLDALRLGAAPEVERNAHLDLLVLQHALEVDVHDLVLVRVALHVLEDCGLLLFADLERQDSREEALVVYQLRELRVVDDEGARVALAPRSE